MEQIAHCVSKCVNKGWCSKGLGLPPLSPSISCAPTLPIQHLHFLQHKPSPPMHFHHAPSLLLSWPTAWVPLYPLLENMLTGHQRRQGMGSTVLISTRRDTIWRSLSSTEPYIFMWFFIFEVFALLSGMVYVTQRIQKLNEEGHEWAWGREV